jgi:universal stress protein A
MMTVKKILVPTDFGEASDGALAYGRELAMRFGATLHVLHVAQDIYVSAFGAENYAVIAPGLQQQLEAAARQKLEGSLMDSDGSGPPTKSVVFTSSSASFSIIDYATTEDIDLIVMGTHGRTALAHMLLGSVAERVVRLAPCPVLTVKQPEHEFVHADALAPVAAA